jgi:hypothetical protein
MLLVNLSKETQNPKLIFADGSKDSIILMSHSRARIQDGAKLDPEWVMRNPNTIRVISEDDLKKEKDRVTRIYEAAINSSKAPIT